MKKCSKCGELKPRTEFHKNKNYKDGLWLYCKKCRNEMQKAYGLKHRDKIKKKTKRYYHSHKDYYASKNKKYRKTHGVELSKYRKSRYYNPPSKTTRIKIDRNRCYECFIGGRYVHDVIAEQVLNRRLRKGEMVHHHDRNGLNNNHNNLLICTNEYHAHLHNRMRRKQAIEETK